MIQNQYKLITLYAIVYSGYIYSSFKNNYCFTLVVSDSNNNRLQQEKKRGEKEEKNEKKKGKLRKIRLETE